MTRRTVFILSEKRDFAEKLEDVVGLDPNP